jgi:hypothetical protein
MGMFPVLFLGRLAARLHKARCHVVAKSGGMIANA